MRSAHYPNAPNIAAIAIAAMAIPAGRIQVVYIVIADNITTVTLNTLPSDGAGTLIVSTASSLGLILSVCVAFFFFVSISHLPRVQ